MAEESAAEVADWLDGIADRLRDPAPALEAEAERVNEMIAAAFATQTGPDGMRWPARARGRESTGELERSARARVEGDALVVEATAPHAGFVHSGTRTMDARPFLPYGPDLEPLTTGPGGAWWSEIDERLATYFVGDDE